MSKKLESLGLKVWFDDKEMMTGEDIHQQMSNGIDASRVILVFVTKSYIKKVSGNGPSGNSDNCLYEFRYATQAKQVK